MAPSLMLSPPVVRPSNPPRVELVPESDDWSVADEALAIIELAGLELDDWQRWVLYQSMGLRAGRFAALETGVFVPRQNGKTEIIVGRCLAALFSERIDARLSIYTAHEYKTAREVFFRMASILQPPVGADEFSVADASLREMVKTVRTANGEEAIELANGRRLRFLARTSGSGRGFTADLVILDEAHKLADEQMAALLPTMSAKPNPQIWYAAAGPMDSSNVQLRIRGRALAGSSGLAYFEYSATDDADLDDESEWVAANPACPARIGVDFIRQEREAMGEVEFARERMCLHDGGRLQAVIAADVWHGLADSKSKVSGARVFAVDVPPDRDHASIVVAGEREDGRCHVELVEYGPGTAWVIPRLVELVKKWDARLFLDPSAAAGGLIPDLVSGGVEPELVSGREMTQACGRFVDMAKDGRIVHHTGHDDHKLVNLAVDAGRKRAVGEAWAWHRKDTSVDISPLVAATLAVFGVSKPVKTEKQSRKPGKMWGF